MAIAKVGKISNITPPKAVSNITNASKTLQSQLQMKQQTLKKLSSDSSLSIDEKEKQRQELQKEIEALEHKLEQMRLKQEEEKKAEQAKQKEEVALEEVTKEEEEKENNETTAIKDNEKKKAEIKELSVDEVHKMLDKNLQLKEEMVQQGVEYDQQNTVRVLSSEIRQNELLGTNTETKEAQLEEMQKKENFWLDAKNKENAKKQQEAPPLINPDMQVAIEQ